MVTTSAVRLSFLASMIVGQNWRYSPHGIPASTLTDNGLVFTTRLAAARSRNDLETELATLGITQKNGKPNHPQTQGKVERFHQTLKRWLARQPPAATLAVLQQQLDAFTTAYNQHRPHRALDRKTPAAAYTARPKATPAPPPEDRHWGAPALPDCGSL